jgi:hypothetical protein
MKLDGNFSITTMMAEFSSNSQTNSENNLSVNTTSNLDFGNTDRLSNLFSNSQTNNTESNSLTTGNQTQNSPMMDLFKSMVGSFAKMLGIDPQKMMQFLGLDNQQPTNTQNYKTGAGAINNVGGKAADKANDPLIKEAMDKMQAEQAANPGKPVKMTVKGSDGKKYKLSLDENGQMNIKKKGGGFLGGLLKGLGGLVKTGLGLVSQFGSFIPGWGTVASIGSSMLLSVMNKK